MIVLVLVELIVILYRWNSGSIMSICDWSLLTACKEEYIIYKECRLWVRMFKIVVDVDNKKLRGQTWTLWDACAYMFENWRRVVDFIFEISAWKEKFNNVFGLSWYFHFNQLVYKSQMPDLVDRLFDIKRNHGDEGES